MVSKQSPAVPSTLIKHRLWFVGCGRYVRGQGWRLRMHPELIIAATAMPSANGPLSSGAARLGSSAEFLASLRNWLKVRMYLPVDNWLLADCSTSAKQVAACAPIELRRV